MSRKINLKCPHCKHSQSLREDDLTSGVSLKNDAGKVVQDRAPVVVDENTFIACEKCGYPIQCSEANATFSA